MMPRKSQAAQEFRVMRLIASVVSLCRHPFGLACLTAVSIAGSLLGNVSPTRAEDQVQLELIGTREPRCGISDLQGRLDLGRLDRAGTSTITFTVDCNTPFSYALTSRHGSLVPLSAPGVASEAAVAYQVATHIQTSGGPLLSDACPSISLLEETQSCNLSNSGNAIALNAPASITVSWQAPGARILPAGLYEDYLTLVLSPQP